MIRQRGRSMRLLARLLEPKATAYAHCDLPCGVYDPAQARIEAESVKAICQKYQDSKDPAFQTRALIIKEQRSELVKHHLRGLEVVGPQHPQMVLDHQGTAVRAGQAPSVGAVDRLLQAPALREVPAAPHA